MNGRSSGATTIAGPESEYRPGSAAEQAGRVLHQPEDFADSALRRHDAFARLRSLVPRHPLTAYVGLRMTFDFLDARSCSPRRLRVAPHMHGSLAATCPGLCCDEAAVV